MKNYRLLIPVVLIVLMLASWYTLIADSAKLTNAYEDHLEEARGFAKTGVTKYALEHYQAALAVEDNPEIWTEVAAYLKENESQRKYSSWCEEYYDSHPMEPSAYDCMLDSYYTEKDYESCFDVLSVAKKRGLTSDKMEEIYHELEYVYEIDYSSYEAVGTFSDNLCPVRVKGQWGFVNRYGAQRVGCMYPEVGVFTNSGMAPVVEDDGDAFFIDEEGNRILATTEEFKRFGNLAEDKFAAQFPNGKYSYVNTKFEKLFGEYDYATTFNCGVAAVQSGGKWMLVDDSGKQVGNKQYLDIKLDEKEIACRYNRIFVSETKDQWILVDESGKRVGSDTYDDVFLFMEENATAVKKGGKWLFIDLNGKPISDKTYQEARPFSCGLAAVKISGKWGFVDESETVVIEPVFQAAKDFTAKGSCFISNGETWEMLKLYRLNREG